MQYVEFNDKYGQQKLVRLALRKAGGDRKLANIIGASKGAIYDYSKAKRRMPYNRFKLFLKYLSLDEESFSFNLVLKKEWLSRGGKKSYLQKIKNNSFENNLRKMKESSSARMKKWHREMRQNHRTDYFKIQYQRFKKVGNYKFTTKKGEKVRNKLEKYIADTIFALNLDYEYEPFLDLGRKVYFPDFKVGNILIEGTMWRGAQKAYQLRKKIFELEKERFQVVVVVPSKLEKYYKIIVDYVVKEEELKNFLNGCRPSSSDKARH